MSYIVGWKRNGCAYLCADSALTKHGADQPPILDTSSFGEKCINTDRRRVFEGSLKLFNLGHAFLAAAGRVANINRVVLALGDELRHLDDVRVAFSRSINETLRDDDSQRSVHFILAAPTSSGAILLFYNADGQLNIREASNDEIVNFGSIGQDKRKLTWSAIKKVSTNVQEPERQLACVLGVLQSYGINTNLMEDGVGGAFYGAYVTPNRLEWQGDILYVIRQPENYWALPIATCIRDDAVVVKSGIKKGTIVLASTFSVGFDAEWMSKWSDYTNRGSRTGCL